MKVCTKSLGDKCWPSLICILVCHIYLSYSALQHQRRAKVLASKSEKSNMSIELPRHCEHRTEIRYSGLTGAQVSKARSFRISQKLQAPGSVLAFQDQLDANFMSSLSLSPPSQTLSNSCASMLRAISQLNVALWCLLCFEILTRPIFQHQTMQCHHASFLLSYASNLCFRSLLYLLKHWNK